MTSSHRLLVSLAITGGVSLMSIGAVAHGQQLPTRVFVIHGFNQDAASISLLAARLGAELDATEPGSFEIDGSFDWGECAGTCSDSCTLAVGASKLADLVKDRTDPGQKAVLVGYSMGGLLARYAIALELLGGVEVRALITLGTPNLGVPYTESDPWSIGLNPLDLDGVCKDLGREMAGQLNFPTGWEVKKDFVNRTVEPFRADSLYLLNLQWDTQNPEDLPPWFAVAGAGCSGDSARLGEYRPAKKWAESQLGFKFKNKVKQGCPEGAARNDGLVCEQSATYSHPLLAITNGPDRSAVWQTYTHRDGWVKGPFSGPLDCLEGSASFLDPEPGGLGEIASYILENTAPDTPDPTLNGLVVWFDFESANPGIDVQGGHNAAPTNVVSVPGGRVGNAGEFTSGWMQLGSSPDLDLLAGDFTLAAWVKTSNLTNRNWFAKSTGNEHMYGIGQDPSGHAGFGLHGGGAGPAAWSTTVVFDGEWHHVAAVLRGTTEEIWVDGVLEATAVISKNFVDSGAFAVGRLGQCCEWFNGLMDEVKIWNRGLSAGEIGLEASR